MFEDEVGDDFDPVFLRGADQIFQALFAAETRFNLGLGDRPVAVVTGVGAIWRKEFLPRRVRVAVQRCEPEHVDPDLFEIAFLDLFLDPLEVAAEIVGLRENRRIFHRPVVILIAVHEAIGKRVVDDPVLPPESLLRADLRTDGAAHAALVVGRHNADPRTVRDRPGGNPDARAIQLNKRREAARSVRAFENRRNAGDRRAARNAESDEPGHL